ncbi:glycoside hydrolase family 114 protein, partial [Piromyces sp. E2]
NRFKRASKYGCDAVEVDSLDIHNHLSEYTKEDTTTFAKWIAKTAQEENMPVGLKNLPSLAKKLEPYFYFAVVESCALYDECKYFKVFTENEKPVFTVHYKEHGWKLSGSKLNTLKKAQNYEGFTCILSNYDLRDNSINYDCKTGKLE